MPEPSVDQEAEAEIPRPPSAWWRQRWLWIAESIALIAILTGVLVVLAPWSDFIRGLAGGVLFGLGATMVIGFPFSTRDAWEQQWGDYRVWRALKLGTDDYVTLVRARTVNAFYLGADSQLLAADEERIPERLENARQRCAISGVTFSAEEVEFLERSGPTRAAAAQLSDLISQKAQQRGPEEWAFFRLGQLVASIVSNLENNRPIQPIMQQLGRIQRDKFIQLNARFADVITGLLKGLSRFDETASGEPRRLMIGQVLALLSKLPTHEIDIYGQDREQFRILEDDEWYWAQDESGNPTPVCFSAGYMLTAQSDWEYVVSKESTAYEAQVKRPEATWDCSVHAEACGDSPCFDIRLIFDHTGGGVPVTEARTRLIRYEPVEQSPETDREAE